MAGQIRENTASWTSNESIISALLGYIANRSIPESTFDILVGLCAGRKAKVSIERKRTLESSQSRSSCPTTSYGSGASSTFSSRHPFNTQQASRPSSVSSSQDLNQSSVFTPSNPIDFPTERITEEIDSDIDDIDVPPIPGWICPHQPPFYPWDPEQRPMTTAEYLGVDSSRVVPTWKKEYEQTKKHNPLSILPTRSKADLAKVPKTLPYEQLTFERQPVPKLPNYQAPPRQRRPARAPRIELPAATRPALRSSDQRHTTTGVPQRPQLGRRRKYVNYSDSGTRLD